MVLTKSEGSPWVAAALDTASATPNSIEAAAEPNAVWRPIASAAKAIQPLLLSMSLEKELEKLFTYTLPEEVFPGGNSADSGEREAEVPKQSREITVEDIDAICTTQISNKIFDMVEAVAAKQQKKALNYYYDLLALKEPPMRILYLLARQFRLLLEVKDLLGRGHDKAQIAM